MSSRDYFSYIKASTLPEIKILNSSIYDFKYIKHSHDDYAIGVTTSGHQSFFCAGSYYKVPKGGIILINPEEPHDGYSEVKTGYSYYMIYIPRRFFLDMLKQIYNKTIRDFTFKQTVVFDNVLKNNLLSVINVANTKENTSFPISELFIEMIEALFNRNSDNSFDEISNLKRDSLITKATNFIDATIEEQLTLDDICNELNISKYHFIRMFKKQVGMTPYQYMLDSKIKLACKDLELGVDILNIVEKYGFYDLSHFHKRFKGVFGLTPFEYQKYMVLKT